MYMKMDFFGAANGYSGFRSYFNRIFNSEEFDRIYVIKGGPGTGKSSFMKKICSRYQDENLKIERIHCSSDPESLDGVIITSDDKKIALLDGTAPHERDAVVVSAIDEIVNLAEGLDRRFLSAEKEEILYLSKEKKRAYDTAYAYLNIAGEVEKFKKTNSPIYSGKKVKNRIKKLAEIKKSNLGSKRDVRLISSFGARGEVRFDTIEAISRATFSIVGDYCNASALMNEIAKLAIEEDADTIVCPAPLDGRIEAIYFPLSGISFIIGGKGEKISADSYFPVCPKIDVEIFKKANELSKSAEEEARRWFGIASDFHFRLEEKYIRAMDFSYCDEVFSQKTKEIDELFKR